MQAVTKIADLTKFRQTYVAVFVQNISPDGDKHVGEFDDFSDFYANYIMSYPRGADD